jgi:predicted amidohydrolase
MAEQMMAAAVQTTPSLGDVSGNCAALLAAVRSAAADGAGLIVFPECHLSGYGFRDRTAALSAAQAVPGQATRAVADACRQLGVHVVFGLIERDGGTLFNTAVLVGPGGLLARYRKAHLTRLGVDLMVQAGAEPFPVTDTTVGRVGLSICYDLRFPEVCRSLALLGAQIIVVPTCWPAGSEPARDIVARSRALENHVFLVIAGQSAHPAEGTDYIGGSSVIDPVGTVLARVESGAGIAIARVDPGLACDKTITGEDGRLLAHLFADRRPDLYATRDVTSEPGT